MQLNKNGIPVQRTKKTQKRQELDYSLPLRKFVLIDDEAEVEVFVPEFSPILDVLLRDGWREVK